MNTRPLLSHFLKQSETAERYTSTVSLKPSTPVARDHSDPLDVDLEGLLSQAPIDNKVEKGPDRRDMSPLGTIRRLEYTINKQKESIDDMKVEAAELNVILGTNIRLRKILTSISFVT